MNSRRKPAEVLAESRRQDSRAKRQRVLATVDQMLAQGDPVTFAAVARTARVSNWLVYADGVREHIEKARGQQASRPAQERLTRATTSSSSIRTDLELARAEIQALRQERDQLKGVVQRSLGQQLEQVASKDLVTRIDELTRHKHELTARLNQVQGENSELQRRLRESEDDVAAVRSNLRRMIRSGVQAEVS
ncbi:DUF6262 family protein [Streptomyces blastmyceticus]|uniref:Uncharacterized protein n=1 Tax=Streptomyces blastmyceticus TaxID=68180 RepID=A0ABP3HUW0_9ACTN